MSGFSDYIVYLDESGSPVLNTNIADYPVFVLACILMNKKTYAEQIVPAIQKFKFKYLGHDQIVLHEHDIRRQAEKFTFLRANKEIRINFLSDLSNLIHQNDFEILTCVIDKTELRKNYHNPFDPYKLALLFSMENLALRLETLGQCGKTIHIIAESRGKKEDRQLGLEFKRIKRGKPFLQSNQADLFKKFDWQILFSDKKANSTGLQLADLIARPIGIHTLRPQQDNKAYEIIKKKKLVVKHFP